MAFFNNTNFERQGNTENDIKLSSTEDIISAVITLSGSALKTIKIFTSDLEYQIYHDEKFRKNILNFVRGNRHAHIQILANDTDSAIKQGHSLIHLNRQLTSAMSIKIIPTEYENQDLSFILIDQTTFIYKAQKSKQHALQSSCKNRANKLNDYFTLIWEQAEPDPKTRSLYI